LRIRGDSQYFARSAEREKGLSLGGASKRSAFNEKKKVKGTTGKIALTSTGLSVIGGDQHNNGGKEEINTDKKGRKTSRKPLYGGKRPMGMRLFTKTMAKASGKKNSSRPDRTREQT